MRRIVLMATAVVCVVLAAACAQLHSSDEEMIRSFYEHKQQYAELLEMFQADAGLKRVSDMAGNWPVNPAKVGVDDARLERYRSLMKQLGVQSLERYGKHRVLFVTSVQGLAPSGSTKGYVYAEKSPSPLVDDTERGAVAGEGEVYRQIGDGWYLFYEWN